MLQHLKLYASGLAIAAAVTGVGLSSPAEAKARHKAPKTEITQSTECGTKAGFSLFNFFKRNDVNAPTGSEGNAQMSASPSGSKFDSGLHAVPASVHGNILVRYFKAENQVEIWQANDQGEFSKLRTFTITKMGSRGKLGPKAREGDLTTPEGIWYISHANLAPTKSFKMPVYITYPNALESFQNRTGSHVLFHNDIGMVSDPQSTASCVALSDPEYQEFRGYMEAAFARGQKFIQIIGFPFRMTAQNMISYAKNPNYKAFFAGIWGQLKKVYDAFEDTKQQPAVAYCATGYKLASELSTMDMCVPATTQDRNALRTVVAEAKSKFNRGGFSVAAITPAEAKPAPEARPEPPKTVPMKIEPAKQAMLTPAYSRFDQAFQTLQDAEYDDFSMERAREMARLKMAMIDRVRKMTGASDVPDRVADTFNMTSQPRYEAEPGAPLAYNQPQPRTMTGLFLSRFPKLDISSR
jgi:murein L,D-transpeptidase YafK